MKLIRVSIILFNYKNIKFVFISIAKKDSSAGSQFETFEKYNWYIYLQYVHGEQDACKELINKELGRSKGRNEFVLFTKVSTETILFLCLLKFSNTRPQ